MAVVGHNLTSKYLSYRDVAKTFETTFVEESKTTPANTKDEGLLVNKIDPQINLWEINDVFAMYTFH